MHITCNSTSVLCIPSGEGSPQQPLTTTGPIKAYLIDTQSLENDVMSWELSASSCSPLIHRGGICFPTHRFPWLWAEIMNTRRISAILSHAKVDGNHWKIHPHMPLCSLLHHSWLTSTNCIKIALIGISGFRTFNNFIFIFIKFYAYHVSANWLVGVCTGEESVWPGACPLFVFINRYNLFSSTSLFELLSFRSSFVLASDAR